MCVCIYIYIYTQTYIYIYIFIVYVDDLVVAAVLAGELAQTEGDLTGIASIRIHACMRAENGNPCWQKPCWQIYAHGLHGYVGASTLVAPLRKRCDDLSWWHFLVVQPVHLHPHTRAASARKDANMASANITRQLFIHHHQ